MQMQINFTVIYLQFPYNLELTISCLVFDIAYSVLCIGDKYLKVSS